MKRCTSCEVVLEIRDPRLQIIGCTFPVPAESLALRHLLQAPHLHTPWRSNVIRNMHDLSDECDLLCVTTSLAALSGSVGDGKLVAALLGEG